MSSVSIKYRDLFIDGKWITGKGNPFSIINPATEKEICKLNAASTEDINTAVIAARKAFERKGKDAWSSLSGSQRATYLREIAKKIASKKEHLARLETMDCGKPYREAAWDMDDVSACFDYYANLAEELDKRQSSPIDVGMDNFKTVIQYAPMGVVVAITPWNYPLLMATWKIAPILASGCSVILKPSELAPLTCLELAAIIQEVGIPHGVFNLILGGPEVGAPLSQHPGIDKIAFTGSVATGINVMTAATKGVKNVSLELGGKSPLIVFDDVDLIEAVEWIMFGVFWTNGQICSSTSRVLLHEKIYDQVLNALKKQAEKIYVGDPFTENDPSMGPLVSKKQRDKVLSYIEKGKIEGAKLLCGGEAPSQTGFYVKPTVFYDVQPHMTIWKEEIFGPVLSVMKFKTEEEALELANNTDFGLGAGVMSKDQARCDRVVKQLRAGIVWVNCSQPCFCQAPWGGMKMSGTGRELGQWGLDNYLEVKQVTSYLEKEPGKWGWFIKNSKL